MENETIRTEAGNVVYCRNCGKIRGISDFLDIVISNEITALDLSCLPDGFLDLQNGTAGEYLQKVSNYNKRLIIIGDYSHIAKKSLRDFIYESNKNGQVVFAKSIDEGIKLL